MNSRRERRFPAFPRDIRHLHSVEVVVPTFQQAMRFVVASELEGRKGHELYPQNAHYDEKESSGRAGGFGKAPERG